MAIRICPQCGGKCTDTKDICIHCGFSFKKKVERFCPECGASVGADVHLCPECGFDIGISDDGIKESAITDIQSGNIGKRNKGSSVVGITCPNCGSSYYTQINDDTFKCASCESIFRINKGPNTVITGNVTINNITKTDDYLESIDAYTRYFKVEPDETKKQFLKAVYKALFDAKDVPDDIFDMELMSFEENNQTLTAAYGFVNITYSVSVGTDRQELYYVKVKKKDERDREYIDLEERTRTVTDWRPTSGTARDQGLSCVWNDKDNVITNGDSLKDFDHYLNCCCAINNPGNLKPNKDALDKIKSNISSRVFNDAFANACEHMKSLNLKSSMDYQNIICFLIPTHIARFSYHGKGFSIGRIASGSNTLKYIKASEKPKKPSNDTLSSSELEAANKRRKQFMVPGIVVAAVASTFLYIFYYIIQQGYKWAAIPFIVSLFIIPVGALLIVFGVIQRKKVQAIIDGLVAESARKKVDGYKRKLEELEKSN